MITIANVMAALGFVAIAIMIVLMSSRNEKWVGFNPLDFIPKLDRPRTTAVPLLYEINAGGDIRVLRRYRGVYQRVNTVVENGDRYFNAVVGWSGNATVKVKIKIEDIVKTCFGF